MRDLDRWATGIWAAMGLVAVYILLSYVGRFTSVCELGTILDPAHGEPSSWCFEFWLNRYQQLITGGFAILAALIAWRAVMIQVAVSESASLAAANVGVRALIISAVDLNRIVNELVEPTSEALTFRRNGSPFVLLRELPAKEAFEYLENWDREWKTANLTDSAYAAFLDLSAAADEFLREIVAILGKSDELADGSSVPRFTDDQLRAIRNTHFNHFVSASTAYQAVFQDVLTRIREEQARIQQRRSVLHRRGLPF